MNIILWKMQITLSELIRECKRFFLLFFLLTKNRGSKGLIGWKLQKYEWDRNEGDLRKVHRLFHTSNSCIVLIQVPSRKAVVEGDMEQRSGGESAIIQSWPVKLRLTRRSFTVTDVSQSAQKKRHIRNLVAA